MISRRKIREANAHICLTKLHTPDRFWDYATEMRSLSSEKLQAELLRAIRGKLTTSALSAKLGYKFNQVARWEKGERRLLWIDFVAICDSRKLPLAHQVKLYLGFESDLRNTARFTRTLLAGKPVGEIAKTAKLNRSKISRWLSGKAEPTFLDVVSLLRSSINLLSFLEPLLDLTKVPCIARDYEQFRRQRELVYSMPYLDTLLEALLLEDYQKAAKHDPALLGKVAGLPTKTVTMALASLEAAGMVERAGEKFQAIEIGIDYRSDRARMVKNILHWLSETARSVQCIEKRPLKGSLVGFSVLSLSGASHEKALTLFRDFNRAIHALGTDDRGPKEKVLVLVNSLMDAERFGDPS
jgi:DNA-binding transcriptional regulator YiaG